MINIHRDTMRLTEEKGIIMLKIVVFDSGFGGELFADRIEEQLPIVEVIRVIDWRHADQILQNYKTARACAEEALRPYIGKVDLIVFANHLLSVTSLRYFQNKFREQKFIGFSLEIEQNDPDLKTAILTTKAVTKTFNYFQFSHRLKAKTITLDDWPSLIDDGELEYSKIKHDLLPLFRYDKYMQLFLACGQFTDIKAELKKLFGGSTKIVDSFDLTLRQICLVLKIRGSLRKKK